MFKLDAIKIDLDYSKFSFQYFKSAYYSFTYLVSFLNVVSNANSPENMVRTLAKEDPKS